MGQPWEFVGRTVDLARLESAADDASCRGRIFSGAAGIGKSRLLREAAQRLPVERYSVHVAAAGIAAAELPFGGLAEILPPDPPPGAPVAGLLRWAAESLQEQAGGRPIVLVVDDAHLLDPSSAALAHMLVRQGATLLATLRTGEPVPAPIAALWTEDLVEHADLPPLTDEETRDLLAAMLGAPVEAGSALRLGRLAGGNPLLLRELVSAARAGGEMTSSFSHWRWTGRLTLPPSLADLVSARIGTLTPAVRDVLELVAFGEPLGLSHLLRACDPAAVEEAEERGLIRVVEDGKRHDVCVANSLYGEVVRQHCPVTRSRRLLATLAGLVEDSGARRHDDLLRVASWRLDSDTAQDGAMLLDAAEQAFGRFELELAARLATGAYTADAGYPAAELLAIVLQFADRAEDAMQVLEHVTDGPPARWATSRAAVAFWGLGRAAAADELAAARTGDAAEQARMRSVEALMRLQLNNLDQARALAHGVLGDEAADAPAVRTARCVLAYLAAAGGDPDASAELLSGSAGRQDTATLQYAVPMALGARVSIGLDLAGIDEVLAAEFAGLAQSGGFGFGSGWASLLQAQGAWLRGRTTVAVEACEQACAALTANRIHNGNAHAARAFALAVRGDVELAEAAMASAEAAAGHCAGLFYPWQTQARAWTSACAGDVPGAVRLLQDLILRLRADGLAGHELLALHDLVRLGRADLAADRMQALLGTVPGGRAAPLLMRHARAAADGSGNALLAVAREFNTNGYLVFAAEAAAAAVRLFRQARDPQAVAANTLLADVLERCDSVHTPALRSVRPALTNRERQVARLAANGAKSREIAHQLFLSPRTVENHLQRVYAKLGVNGRDALAPALRSLPQ